MSSLCCDVEEPGEERIVGIRERRKCRDVLFIILFGLFWIGMFVICGMAAQQGDVDRLVYSLDSYGLLCGTVNKWNGQTVDLRKRQKLYYLNTLSLVDVFNLKYAKTICVESCPSGPRVCGLDDLPCKNNTQYRCPYYRFAEDNVYGTLVDLEKLGADKDFNTTYFSALKTTTQTQCNRSLPVTDNIKFASSFLTADTCGEYYQMSSQYNQGPCYPTWLGTVDYFHTCYPDASLEKVSKNVVSFTVKAVDQVARVTGVTDKVKSSLTKLQHRFLDYLADLERGWAIWVVSGLIGGLVLSVVWMILVRFFGGIMTWATIILLNLAFLVLTLFCFAKGKVIPGGAFVGRTIEAKIAPGLDPAKVDRRVWIVIGVFCTIITVALMICTCCMIRQLQVAIATLKVAVKAVVHMPSLFVFPLLPFVLTCALVVYWVSISLLLWSAGDIRPHYKPAASLQAYSVAQLFNSVLDGSIPLPPAPSLPPPPPPLSTNQTVMDCSQDPRCFYEFKWNTNLRYAFVWHLFGLLWTYQFIYGFAYVTIAGAVAYFYWNRTDNSMPTFPVVKGMANAARYHLGSIALGSFILALLELVRLFLIALQKMLKSKGAGCCGCGACFVQWCLCCAQCCVSCLQSIVDFINRNAYVMIAIKGKGYCSSAKTALNLIGANPGRQLAVEVVSHFLLWFGKLAVAATCGIFAFLMTSLDQYSDKQGRPRTFITTPAIVVIISVAIGYIVADIFFAIYEVAVQTIFLSFCEDIAAHGGVPRYAPPVLLEAIGEYRTKAYGDGANVYMKPADSQFMISDTTNPSDTNYNYGTGAAPGLAAMHSPPVPASGQWNGGGPSTPPGYPSAPPGYPTMAPPQPAFTPPVSPPPVTYAPVRPQAFSPPSPPMLRPYPTVPDSAGQYAPHGPAPPGYPAARPHGGSNYQKNGAAGYGPSASAGAPPPGYPSIRREVQAPMPNKYPSLTPYTQVPPNDR